MALPSIPPHYEFDNKDYWLDFLASQRGGDIERYFISDLHQRGEGLGTLLRVWGSRLLPFLKNLAVPVGKELLKGVKNISSGLLQGEPPKETVETHGREAAANLLETAAKKVRKGNIRRKKKDVFTSK